MNIDMNFIYAISIVIIVISISTGISYLKRRNILKNEDIKTAIKIFNLTSEIAIDIGLVKDNKSKEIMEIVSEGLNYVSKYISTQDICEKEQLVFDYCVDLCVKTEIKLTPQRIDIIKQLIRGALKITDK